jgi:ribonuclease BN (tRNA processing enzyme)
MEIIFLGTGDAFSKQYGQTNTLLRFNDTNLLIDCGTTCCSSLYQLGIPLADIQNVFVSHLHADHIGGLEELALQNKYIFRKKIDLYVAESLLHDLWEYSLRGGLEYTNDDSVTLDYYFNLHPVSSTQGSFVIAGVSFDIIPTLHVRDMKSFGLYFHRVFYSDDVVFNESLLYQMAKKSDIIIHDCTFKENPVHTYYESLLTLPLELRQKMYLIHYNDKSEAMRARMPGYGMHCAEKHMCLRVHESGDGTLKVLAGSLAHK